MPLLLLLAVISLATECASSESQPSTLLQNMWSFFRSLLGDNTPGQAALAGIPVENFDSKMGPKIICLSLLSLIGFAVYSFVSGLKLQHKCRLEHTNCNSNGYRNMDLTENFL